MKDVQYQEKMHIHFREYRQNEEFETIRRHALIRRAEVLLIVLKMMPKRKKSSKKMPWIQRRVEYLAQEEPLKRWEVGDVNNVCDDFVELLFCGRI